MNDDGDRREDDAAEFGGRLRTIVGDPRPRHTRAIARLRSYFLTGLVIAAPVSITAYVTWWFIRFVDDTFKPLIPEIYDPDRYLPFSIPGVGLVVALILMTALGALAANLLGRTIVGYGEQLLDRMPIVRNLYRALKQIFETVLSQSNQSFREVGLIEYPRRGVWALAFVSTEARGEVAERAGGGERMLSLFLPTTPNPTSGFLLFVPESDVLILDMSVEDAAKLIISAGLVVPGETMTREQAVAAVGARPKAKRRAGKTAPVDG